MPKSRASKLSQPGRAKKSGGKKGSKATNGTAHTPPKTPEVPTQDPTEQDKTADQVAKDLVGLRLHPSNGTALANKLNGEKKEEDTNGLGKITNGEKEHCISNGTVQANKLNREKKKEEDTNGSGKTNGYVQLNEETKKGEEDPAEHTPLAVSEPLICVSQFNEEKEMQEREAPRFPDRPSARGPAGLNRHSNGGEPRRQQQQRRIIPDPPSVSGPAWMNKLNNGKEGVKGEGEAHVPAPAWMNLGNGEKKKEEKGEKEKEKKSLKEEEKGEKKEKGEKEKGEKEKLEMKTSATAEKEKEETAALPPSLNVKHPLRRSWSFKYYQDLAGLPWDQRWQDIATVSFAEDFWALFRHLHEPSRLKPAHQYAVFVEGSRPEWADESNKRGGRWVCDMSNNARDHLDQAWLSLLLTLIGETLVPDSEEAMDLVNGAVFHNRARNNRLELWLRSHQDLNVLRRIGVSFKASVAASAQIRVSYTPHAVSSRTTSRDGRSAIMNV